MSGTDLSHRNHVGGLFRAHYPWLCARLRQHLGASASVEDIAADTFVQLLESPNLTPIREPRALLTTIARRRVYELWRRANLERQHLERCNRRTLLAGHRLKNCCSYSQTLNNAGPHP